MNKLLISALLGMVVSSNTYADVTVNIDRNLQILAVNGVEPEISFGHTDEMTLPNGLNQLLVRLEKVIHFGGLKINISHLLWLSVLMRTMRVFF